MAIRKLQEKKWAYTLFDADGKKILSVVCGGAGLYDLKIELSASEVQKMNEDASFVESLASAIRDNPKAYEDRRVK